MNDAYFKSAGGQEYLARVSVQRLASFEDRVGPVILFARNAGSFMSGPTIVIDGALDALVA